jgi:predicted nuclease with TOPRIM domain
MKNNHNIFWSSSISNDIFFSPEHLNYHQSSAIEKNASSIPLFNIKKFNKIKKRNYNELMENCKEKFNELYKMEKEDLYKTLNRNFKKNKSNLKINNENNFRNENTMLESKKKEEKNKEIKLQGKKFIMEDEIDNVEKDFLIEKGKKNQKKYNLSKSYLYDEESPFFSDLEDTKENSFSSLNFSVDYPEINLDNSIKNKLITNAIELEKTFNRFFNIKNMPNKK